MSAPLRDWYASAVTIAVGEKLLAARPDQPLRTDELARDLGKPERSIRELLDRLNSGRLVTRTPLQTGEPGRPPWGYWLAEDQRPAAQRAVDTPDVLRRSHRKPRGGEANDATTSASTRPTPTTPTVADVPDAAPACDPLRLSSTDPGPGRELVVVDVSGPAYAHLIEALSGTGAADAASWVLRIGDAVVFVFTSGNVAAAGDLLAVLAGARLSVRSASVREVIAGPEFVNHAKRLAPAIRRARSTRDAYDAPQ